MAQQNAMAATLVRDYPGLAAHLWRRTGDRQLANDLLHDAIVTALENFDDGSTWDPKVVAGYVFRTALNHLRNHRRHERLRSVGADDSAIDQLPAAESASPLNASQNAANTSLARRLLLDLGSTRDRELLVRYYLDEHDKDQVCAAFGLSAPQFDRVIGRARARLRKLAERAGYGRWDVLLVLMFCAASGALA